MGDYIVRAMAANQQIRAFAITSRELVEKARSAHNTSPVATAALGRLLSAGAMMGITQESDTTEQLHNDNSPPFRLEKTLVVLLC